MKSGRCLKEPMSQSEVPDLLSQDVATGIAAEQAAIATLSFSGTALQPRAAHYGATNCKGDVSLSVVYRKVPDYYLTAD